MEMNKNVEEETNVKEIILDFIQHNPKHYIQINFFGEIIYPCARCFGLWNGLFFGFILSSPFWLGFFQAKSFIMIFLIAWFFALPSIIDWSTEKLDIRKGSNKIRVTAGFLHGIGVNIYLFILPADIFFKIVTYSLYELIFYLIRRLYHIKHFKIKT